MYSLDITVLDGARIWITGIFVPGECPDLLRGGMGWKLGQASLTFWQIVESGSRGMESARIYCKGAGVALMERGTIILK